MNIEGRQRQAGKSQLTGLRRRAEHRFPPLTRVPATLAQEDMEGLLYELQLHQIELEMQCRQLQDAQYETEESRNSYRELYESMPVGFATVDASGSMSDLNPAGRSLLGLSTGQPLPNFHLCVAAKDLDRFDLLCRSVFAKNHERVTELTLQRADGASFSAEVRIHDVITAVGPRLRLTFQDISARRKAEEMVKVQEAQLEKLLSVREEERRCIANALQDDHCELLSSCLRDIQSVIQRTEGAERERIETIRLRLAELLHSIRRFTSELNVCDTEKVSLTHSMRRYVENLSASAELCIEFREVNIPRWFSKPVEACLYDLMKESLDNVVKHAGAKQAVVTLAGFRGGIEMRILDDGRGFDLTEVLRTNKGRGLVRIRERVRRLEGKVVIQSRPNEGAEIKIMLPTAAMVTPVMPRDVVDPIRGDL